MADSPQLYPQKRAPRVGLHGSLLATIQLENTRQFLVKLHQLSVTGGLLELSAYLDERTSFRLSLQLGSTMVYPRMLHPKAAMLFPMRVERGYRQPFRFTGLRQDECQILEEWIAEMLKPSAALSPARRLGVHPPSYLLES